MSRSLPFSIRSVIAFSSLVLCVVTSATPASASPNLRSYAVTVSSDELGSAPERLVYSEISRGNNAAPVVILINGLIYDMARWNPVTERLIKAGVTVIRMSFSAQPESLRLNRDEPQFLSSGLTANDLAREIEATLDAYQVRKPVTVVGLSYGAAPAAVFAAQNPRRVQSLLLLSPLVVPLDTYDSVGSQLRQWLTGIRFWENAPCAFYGWINPWLCSQQDRWYDSFYNLIYKNYLFVRVSKTPPDLDETVYKKSVFHLVRAVRDFDLKSLAHKLKRVHLVIADGDDESLQKDQNETWTRLPSKEAKSLAVFKGVVHAVPDEAPATTAKWIERVANQDPALQDGALFNLKAH